MGNENKSYCGGSSYQEKFTSSFVPSLMPKLNDSCLEHDNDYSWLLNTSMPWYIFLYEKLKIDIRFFSRNVSNGSFLSRITGAGFAVIVFVATPYFLFKRKKS